jgi:hypothetical protein
MDSGLLIAIIVAGVMRDRGEPSRTSSNRPPTSRSTTPGSPRITAQGTELCSIG